MILWQKATASGISGNLQQGPQIGGSTPSGRRYAATSVA
jgi:hypothetical protein